MRRKYFIHFYRPFANVYNLYYADTPEMEKALPSGVLRISKRDALTQVKEELERKKFDPTFSGFASSAIFPAGYPEDKDIRSDPAFKLKNHIWEKIEK